jgi:D-arabinose 1-dehydrogenase-like Zn-dependent alcohol dehydrogenase
MKGIVFLGERETELREFPDPRPGPRDVILEIKASGMCGTDLKGYRDPFIPGVVRGGIKRSMEPVIAGHEPCGVVVELGAAVTEREAQVGQRVMDHHYQGCGVCRHCMAGWRQMCVDGAIVFGSVAHGAHAPYMKVPVDTLVSLPDELSFETGAAIACGTGTAFGALGRLSLRGDETIAIFGQGPVGLSASQLAHAMGARVIALDLSPERRQLAADMGADITLDPRAGDPVEAILQLTQGEGAHKTLDASSSPEARAPRRCGGDPGLGRLLLRWRGRRGDAGGQPRSVAPADHLDRLVDLFHRWSDRLRPFRRRTGRRCGPPVHAPLASGSGGGGLPAFRSAENRQGRISAVVGRNEK